MYSLRFNPPPEWRGGGRNLHFMGLCSLLTELASIYNGKNKLRMLEIGSYKGESTFMFASLGIFEEIHCIDPYEGEEEANIILNDNWDNVKNEFKINTRHFNNITTHQDYSYNIVDKFPDNYFNFIYIDAEHTYESVKRDIELYLPKCGHIIAGHDYQKAWSGVVRAVDEIIGKPDRRYIDGSWMKKLR